MRLKWIAVGGMALGGIMLGVAPNAASASNSTSAIPHYQHIVEIMMENQSYGTIIGNPSAPSINALANQYGLATNYFGVTHPSEPNYVANMAGSFFGIQDDNQFYCTPALAASDSNCTGTKVNHTIDAPNLAGELTSAGQTWKGYFQSLPPAPSQVTKTGPNANGPYTFKSPTNSNALYASKHNPFVNFTDTQDSLSQMVPDNQLATDLQSSQLPNFSLVVPDQCHDMHGTGSCPSLTSLIQQGDQYVGSTVNEIMASPIWQRGNNAIVVTWDEDDFSDAGQPGTGCCGADPGGGHVVTIVITSGSGNHVTDNTAFNHYSLLRTFEAALGVPCTAHACDSDVPAMTSLFASQNHQ